MKYDVFGSEIRIMRGLTLTKIPNKYCKKAK